MKKDSGKEKKLFGKRRQAERKLKLSEVKFRELFDNMSSGVAVYEARNDGQDFVFVDFILFSSKHSCKS